MENVARWWKRGDEVRVWDAQGIFSFVYTTGVPAGRLHNRVQGVSKGKFITVFAEEGESRPGYFYFLLPPPLSHETKHRATARDPTCLRRSVTTLCCFRRRRLSLGRSSLWWTSHRRPTCFWRGRQGALAARSLGPVHLPALLLLLVEVVIDAVVPAPLRKPILLLVTPRRRTSCGRRPRARHLCRHQELPAADPRTLERGRRRSRLGLVRRRETRVVGRLLRDDAADAAVEHGLAGGVDGLAEGRGQAVQGAVAEDAAEGALAAPLAAGLQGDLAGDVVLVVVDVEAQGAADVVLDDLGQAALAVEDALGGAEDVVAVGEEAGEVGGGAGGDVEDVPDVGDDGERGPLDGEAEGGRVGGDGEVEGARSLALRRESGGWRASVSTCDMHMTRQADEEGAGSIYACMCIPLRSRGRGSPCHLRSCEPLGRRGLGLGRPDVGRGGGLGQYSASQTSSP